VLRYWEQEFTQLKPMKRRGNRRYYQHHEVLLIRRIRELLYEQGFTISGARNRLTDVAATRHETPSRASAEPVKAERSSRDDSDGEELESGGNGVDDESLGSVTLSAAQVRQELLSIRGLLGP
jgi:DNA-binding transcriptional MerR regulator